MKKFILTSLTMILLFQPAAAQKIFATNNGYASFFSEAPISDVDARNGNVKVRLNTSTQELTFDIDMADFEFRNKKMGRDARKKYIETDEFPKASFRGKITSEVDYKKPGKYPVTATGKLEIHGTTKEVAEKGTVTVQKGKIKIESEFYVQLKDYNIDTPSILGQDMTQDKVLVKLEATLKAQ
ncbi:MAG: YceI family protein [Nitrososphaeraceae archaeon]